MIWGIAFLIVAIILFIMSYDTIAKHYGWPEIDIF